MSAELIMGFLSKLIKKKEPSASRIEAKEEKQAPSSVSNNAQKRVKKYTSDGKPIYEE
jgi:hypothetical protein